MLISIHCSMKVYPLTLVYNPYRLLSKCHKTIWKNRTSQTLWVKKCMLTENGFWHEIATQGHSRSSFCNQSQADMGYRLAHRHIILLVLYLKFPKTATQIAKNHRRRQPHCDLTPPRPKEPPRISAYTSYFQKLESLAYIFTADSMSLSLFKFLYLDSPNIW